MIPSQARDLIPVLQALADGEDVQIEASDGTWHKPDPEQFLRPEFCGHPVMRWRVAPPPPATVQYRRYIRDSLTGPHVDTVVPLGPSAETVEGRRNFVRWIDTEWQEIVL